RIVVPDELIGSGIELAAARQSRSEIGIPALVIIKGRRETRCQELGGVDEEHHAGERGRAHDDRHVRTAAKRHQDGAWCLDRNIEKAVTPLPRYLRNIAAAVNSGAWSREPASRPPAPLLSRHVGTRSFLRYRAGQTARRVNGENGPIDSSLPN